VTFLELIAEGEHSSGAITSVSRAEFGICGVSVPAHRQAQEERLVIDIVREI
jgi:hypothetical protein